MSIVPAELVILQCDECKSQNFVKPKNRRTMGNKKLQFRKYCPKCNKHTIHKEARLRD